MENVHDIYRKKGLRTENPWGFKEGDIIIFDPKYLNELPKWGRPPTHRMYTMGVKLAYVRSEVSIYNKLPHEVTQEDIDNRWQAESVGIHWMTKKGTWARSREWVPARRYRKLMDGSVKKDEITADVAAAFEEFGEAVAKRKATSAKRIAKLDPTKEIGPGWDSYQPK